MNATQVRPGEVLYFYPEEMAFFVVMVNDEGIRYIDPNDMEFDDNGNVVTQYVPHEALSEWTISLGTMKDISARLSGK